MPVLFFAAIGMAAFMDFGIGVLIAALVAHAFGTVLAPWQLLIGGVLAFLPDFDIVLKTLQKKYAEVAEHHASPMHRPLLVLPIVTVVAWYFGDTMWATIVFLCVFGHYVHDTKGFSSIGLAWLWPFSKKELSFYGWEDPIPQPGLDHWLHNYWLVPSKLSVREIGIGSLALFVGLFVSYGFDIAIVLTTLVWIGTVMVWILYRIAKRA